MKYLLFITLLFQLSCKEDQKINNELEETRKYIEANREYEIIKGCKVIAFPEVIYSMPVLALTPAAKLLEDNRAYLKITDDFVRSVVLGDIGAVKCLLDKDYDPNTRSQIFGGKKLHSALFWAVVRNFPEIVKLLIEAGADVNEKNEDGDFVLLRTADFLEHTEVAKILKAHGAKTRKPIR